MGDNIYNHISNKGYYANYMKNSHISVAKKVDYPI